MIKIFGIGEEDNSLENEDLLELDEEILPQEIEEEAGQIALDILETKEELFIIAPIAGVELQDIEVSLSKTVLTIKGTREEPEIYKDSHIIMRNKECFWGDFVRNVILPENLNFDSIKAQMDNNLLVISIEKLRFNSQYIKVNKMIR
ncbi:Hsp20/alpha crystallin family protein [Candidatus Gracilibacteria bacterium]|nr:Hsp20/alpha crystallin family protein [Candidatus Gracilibacteria bacterium]NUJ98342.1 Hsp20/alpha crystallin family protein [Candidatus Gracilibacteria bacterium]NUJ99303.1 Hsp20/alpha crystallin family protein [Candidatus Gracilibacteria bacterium]